MGHQISLEVAVLFSPLPNLWFSCSEFEYFLFGWDDGITSFGVRFPVEFLTSKKVIASVVKLRQEIAGILPVALKLGLDRSLQFRAIKRVGEMTDFRFQAQSNLADPQKNMYEFTTDLNFQKAAASLKLVEDMIHYRT